MSYDNKTIYHIGVIDFLEPYSFKKTLETYYKTKFLFRKKSDISCVPPDFY